VEVSRQVAMALACSALDRNLAGLLFFDLDPALVYPLANWLGELLDGPPLIPLGPEIAEDALWERFTIGQYIPERPEDLGFRWSPGRLAGYSRPPGIVVVPDLALLALPAARAAATLIGADVAHLERSGVSQMWLPRDRWLAALRRSDVDKVAPHLLDRFALRVDARDLGLPGDHDPELFQLVRRQLGKALPGLSAEASRRVVAIVPSSAPGLRRDLALARAARALAALAGDPLVTPGHVDEAADLAGLTIIQRPSRRSPVVLAQAGGAPSVKADDGGSPPRFIGPYPEDAVRPGGDIHLLRLGWQRMLTGPPRGQPIGTQRAVGGRDIAVVATLLNAARFQRVRCPDHYRQRHVLHVRTTDLLSYRRAPRPRQLLVLLLDHTCRTQDWDWVEPLAPYLGWAYVARAVVGVVEVGAAVNVPVSELRATQFQARGVLDPRVSAALDRRPGHATPLAHGLTLAAGMLRHGIQQGGPAINEAVLVVVTDGRANVPLADSLAGTVPVNVGQRGVLDALQAARAIRTLRRVRAVVIGPGSRPNGYLSTMLAVELAASLEDGTPAVPGPESVGGAV
jgi:magnesium chelatase subunit D